MTTPSEELVGRVEAATGPDREIDQLIYILATRVLANDHPDAVIDYCVAIRDDGWPWVPSASEPDPGSWHHMSFAPAFTASIDAALALAERLLPEWTVQVFQLRRNKGWGARVSSPRYDTYSSFEDDEHATDDGFTGQANGALALLVAILKALRSLTKLEG